MGNAFDTAKADIEQQRRDANAAIAAAGSAGAAAFAQGQAQVEAARAAAVQQALSEGAKRGQGNIGGLVGGIIGRPYSQLGAGLSSSAASHAADSAFMGAAGDRYFRELGAAVPISQANLETAIARQKAKAANELSDSELRTRLMGAGELMREDDLSGARKTHHVYQVRVEKAKKGIAFIDKQLKAWRNGKANVNAHELVQMKQALEAELATSRTARAPITETLKNAGNHPVSEYARRAGIEAGEDPARVMGLIQPKKPTDREVMGRQPSINEAAQAAGIHGKALRQITRPSGPDAEPTHFEAASKNAETYLKQGKSWRTFSADMKRGLPRQHRTRKLVEALYRPLFDAAGQ
jgi:hypothetical protein